MDWYQHFDAFNICSWIFVGESEQMMFDFGKDLQAAFDDGYKARDAEIVRCENCKHSYEDLVGRVCAYGVCVDCVVPDDWFCADGKRRK